MSANKRQAKNVSTNDRLRVGATSWTTESDVFKKVWQDSLHILCISMYIDIKLENSNEYLNTFSEYIFLFPACLLISHWLTKNAELNSVF